MTRPAHAAPNPARRREEVHESIIQAADRLLKKVGYGQVTIEGIAKEAGAGKQTIYRWWPNKAAIFNEIYDALAARTIPPPDLGSCEAELADYCFHVHKLWRETGAGSALTGMIAGVVEDPSMMPLWRDDFLQRRREAVRTILRRGQTRGEIAKNLDLETATDVIFGVNMYRLLTDQLIKTKEEALKIAALIVAGLKGAKAKRASAKDKN
ncbi:MAG TPA: TetR/AcrR family transcriptional regulator [Candidatus Methylacidiphilales bacterium]